MKKLLTALFLVWSIGQIAVAANGQKQTIVIKTQIYCDHCLMCSSCGSNIKGTIKKTNRGVKKIKVDPAANTITVEYDDAKTTPDKIREAVLASGFDADGQIATAEAVAKLDGCCKKQ